MRMLLFDEVGVLPRVRAADPVVCGRILDPDGPSYRHSPRRSVSFFLAWWLDTRTI